MSRFFPHEGHFRKERGNHTMERMKVSIMHGRDIRDY